jgi:hypothetical protein
VLAEASPAARHGEDEWPIRSDQIIAPRRREDVGQGCIGPCMLKLRAGRQQFAFDSHPFDDVSSTRNLFYGLRVERHVWGGKELSAYWSRFTNDQANYLSVKGAERRDVWDIRFAGKQGPLDWDLKAMGQTGRVGDRQVRA